MDIICNVVEPLFGLDSDYEPQPVLAKDYEVSDDGLTYTIKLREGVTFHNGKELGSEDVVASMNRWLTVNDRAASLLPGATFAASGDHEVTCTLTEPAIDFLIILGNHSQYPGIFPSEVIEAAGDTGRDRVRGYRCLQVCGVEADRTSISSATKTMSPLTAGLRATPARSPRPPRTSTISS